MVLDDNIKYVLITKGWEATLKPERVPIILHDIAYEKKSE